jgi:hypothetical protein
VAGGFLRVASVHGSLLNLVPCNRAGCGRRARCRPPRPAAAAGTGRPQRGDQRVTTGPARMKRMVKNRSRKAWRKACRGRAPMRGRCRAEYARLAIGPGQPDDGAGRARADRAAVGSGHGAARKTGGAGGERGRRHGGEQPRGAIALVIGSCSGCSRSTVRPEQPGGPGGQPGRLPAKWAGQASYHSLYIGYLITRVIRRRNADRTGRIGDQPAGPRH